MIVVSSDSRLYSWRAFVKIYPIKNDIIATQDDDTTLSSEVPTGVLSVEYGITNLQISLVFALKGLNDFPTKMAPSAQLSIDEVNQIKVSNEVEIQSLQSKMVNLIQLKNDIKTCNFKFS